LRLSLQTVLSDDFTDNQGLQALLETLRELGFWGVELNIGNISGVTLENVRRFLDRFDLKLSMLASGLMAKRDGLSLSHPDEEARRRSVARCREMIDWVAGSEAGVIVGFLKGGPAADGEEARRRFSRSLAEIIPHAEARSVAVLIEATNRYESAIANTLNQAAGFLEGYPAACAQILPDTFHMNIEEPDMLGALRAHWNRVSSIHLSDNNRFFPGFGAIDFGRFTAFLTAEGYRGRLAIEGNVFTDMQSDIRASMRRLAPLLDAQGGDS
jgi:D-psicose/D-tagatose/L-ribulose 3-epimerase